MEVGSLVRRRREKHGEEKSEETESSVDGEVGASTDGSNVESESELASEAGSDLGECQSPHAMAEEVAPVDDLCLEEHESYPVLSVENERFVEAAISTNGRGVEVVQVSVEEEAGEKEDDKATAEKSIDFSRAEPVAPAEDVKQVAMGLDKVKEAVDVFSSAEQVSGKDIERANSMIQRPTFLLPEPELTESELESRDSEVLQDVVKDEITSSPFPGSPTERKAWLPDPDELLAAVLGVEETESALGETRAEFEFVEPRVKTLGNLARKQSQDMTSQVEYPEPDAMVTLENLAKISVQYVNEELNAAEEERGMFEKLCPSAGHPLFALLNTFRLKEFELWQSQRRIQNVSKEAQMTASHLWDVKRSRQSYEGYCGDSVLVRTEKDWIHATFDSSLGSILAEQLERLRSIVYEDRVMSSYSSALAFFAVDDFIDDFLTSSPLFSGISDDLPVAGHSRHKSDDLEAVMGLREIISVLFHFDRLGQSSAERQSSKASTDVGQAGHVTVYFNRSVRRWILMCGGILLRVAAYSDHRFLLLELMRTRGCGSWAAPLVQFQHFWTTEAVNDFVARLFLLVDPFVVSSDVSDAGSDAAWFVVDVNTLGETQTFQLAEDDFIVLFEAFPFDSVISFVGSQSSSFRDILKLFSLFKFLLGLLGSTFGTFVEQEHFVWLCGTSLVSLVQAIGGRMAKAEFAGPLAQRLEAEMGELVTEAAAVFLSSKSPILLQFLSYLPFDVVSSEWTWQIFMLFYFGTSKGDPELVRIRTVVEWRKALKRKPGLRSHLVQTVSESHQSWHFFLESFSRLGLCEDKNLAALVALEMFSLGFLEKFAKPGAVKAPAAGSSTSDPSSSSMLVANNKREQQELVVNPFFYSAVREGLVRLCNRHASTLSLLFAVVTESFSVVEKFLPFLFSGLPHDEWNPTPADCAVLRLWLQESTDSSKHSLARLMLSSLVFPRTFASTDLFFPVSGGRSLAAAERMGKGGEELTRAPPPERTTSVLLQRRIALCIAEAYVHHATRGAIFGAARQRKAAFVEWAWNRVRSLPSLFAAEVVLPLDWGDSSLRPLRRHFKSVDLVAYVLLAVTNITVDQRLFAQYVPDAFEALSASLLPSTATSSSIPGSMVTQSACVLHPLMLLLKHQTAAVSALGGVRSKAVGAVRQLCVDSDYWTRTIRSVSVQLLRSLKTDHPAVGIVSLGLWIEAMIYSFSMFPLAGWDDMRCDGDLRSDEDGDRGRVPALLGDEGIRKSLDIVMYFVYIVGTFPTWSQNVSLRTFVDQMCRCAIVARLDITPLLSFLRVHAQALAKRSPRIQFVGSCLSLCMPLSSLTGTHESIAAAWDFVPWLHLLCMCADVMDDNPSSLVLSMALRDARPVERVETVFAQSGASITRPGGLESFAVIRVLSVLIAEDSSGSTNRIDVLRSESELLVWHVILSSLSEVWGNAWLKQHPHVVQRMHSRFEGHVARLAEVAGSTTISSLRKERLMVVANSFQSFNMMLSGDLSIPPPLRTEVPSLPLDRIDIASFVADVVGCVLASTLPQSGAYEPDRGQTSPPHLSSSSSSTTQDVHGAHSARRQRHSQTQPPSFALRKPPAPVLSVDAIRRSITSALSYLFSVEGAHSEALGSHLKLDEAYRDLLPSLYQNDPKQEAIAVNCSPQCVMPHTFVITFREARLVKSVEDDLVVNRARMNELVSQRELSTNDWSKLIVMLDSARTAMRQLCEAPPMSSDFVVGVELFYTLVDRFVPAVAFPLTRITLVEFVRVLGDHFIRGNAVETKRIVKASLAHPDQLRHLGPLVDPMLLPQQFAFLLLSIAEKFVENPNDGFLFILRRCAVDQWLRTRPSFAERIELARGISSVIHSLVEGGEDSEGQATFCALLVRAWVGLCSYEFSTSFESFFSFLLDGLEGSQPVPIVIWHAVPDLPMGELPCSVLGRCYEMLGARVRKIRFRLSSDTIHERLAPYHADIMATCVGLSRAAAVVPERELVKPVWISLFACFEPWICSVGSLPGVAASPWNNVDTVDRARAQNTLKAMVECISMLARQSSSVLNDFFHFYLEKIHVGATPAVFHELHSCVMLLPWSDAFLSREIIEEMIVVVSNHFNSPTFHLIRAIVCRSPWDRWVPMASGDDAKELLWLVLLLLHRTPLPLSHTFTSFVSSLLDLDWSAIAAKDFVGMLNTPTLFHCSEAAASRRKSHSFRTAASEAAGPRVVNITSNVDRAKLSLSLLGAAVGRGSGRSSDRSDSDALQEVLFKLDAFISFLVRFLLSNPPVDEEASQPSCLFSEGAGVEQKEKDSSGYYLLSLFYTRKSVAQPDKQSKPVVGFGFTSETFFDVLATGLRPLEHVLRSLDAEQRVSESLMLESVFQHVLWVLNMRATATLDRSAAMLMSFVAAQSSFALITLRAANRAVTSSEMLAFVDEHLLSLSFEYYSSWDAILASFEVPEIDEQEFIGVCIQQKYLAPLVVLCKQRLNVVNEAHRNSLAQASITWVTSLPVSAEQSSERKAVGFWFIVLEYVVHSSSRVAGIRVLAELFLRQAEDRTSFLGLGKSMYSVEYRFTARLLGTFLLLRLVIEQHESTKGVEKLLLDFKGLEDKKEYFGLVPLMQESNDILANTELSTEDVVIVSRFLCSRVWASVPWLQEFV